MMSDNANRIYNEYIQILSEAPDSYDLNTVKLVQRLPESASPYFAIEILGQSCLNFRGKKVEHLEVSPRIQHFFAKSNIELKSLASKDWLRTKADEFSFHKYHSLVTDIYELYLCSNGFDCCSHYMACSDAKQCVYSDIMFAGKCTYRKKLKSNIIFFGVNRNV